ncbi:hypothetical protein [Seonamhaeicola marinus]|uniref:Uncharacterized protein n=1 Tax=Seonamhaeicola marinus TaxID=1912246 RepID=A0A5D0HFT5_9FLAO|nr:hypothetical protein [Seonamhaeicola marinus]TYA70183.1 hypothetical protein FUA24_23150 [Seonamhaeicola marinus]
MKKICLLLVFSIALLKIGNSSNVLEINAFEKYKIATILFLDGTSIKGYGKLSGVLNKYKIKFKVSKDDKPDVWTELMVKGITFHDESGDTTFLYVKLSKNGYPILLELVEEGVVSLFMEIRTHWINSNVDSNTNFPMHTQVSKTITYFLKHNLSKEVLTTSSSQSLFGNVSSISFGFKKKLKRFFKGCIGIENKLDSGEFNRHTVPEMVYYYNDFCTDL